VATVAVQHVRIPSGNLTLEGALHLPERTPAPGVVVCHPHPLYGGDMMNGVVVGLCRTLADSGFVALRFNFRGVGASEGAYDGGRGERDDVAAATEWLRARREVERGRVALAGYSFGAMVACAAASITSVKALVLISPPVAGTELTIPAGVPILVVAGDADQFAPVAALRAAIANQSNARLEIVAGADHFWWDVSERLFVAVRTFLQEALRAPAQG
jgi:alpha/beta superfamily hydrolase